MTLNNEQRKELHAALLEAFPQPGDLEQMVSFELNENLAAIAGEGRLKDVVFKLMTWAQAQGKLGALVNAARRANSGNPRLRRFEAAIVRARNQRPEDPTLRQFADEVRLSAGPAAAPHQIDAIVRGSPKFENAAAWRAAQTRGELAVCRIECGTGANRFLATGVLIGPGFVLTTSYVIMPLLQKQQTPADVRIRFDYKEYEDGQLLSPGQEYSLAAEWLTDSSPYEALDYTVLRVDGRPGHDSIGGERGAPARGWLTPKPHDFTAGELLFVIQHPDGGPLKLAHGTFRNVDTGVGAGAAPRILYDVPTERGSGGAPVFASDWELVGLHEGVASHATELKRGIPLTPIVERLIAHGVDLPAYSPRPFVRPRRR